MLRGNVGIFTEKGGTIGFLLSPDGTLVIDSQFEDTAPHLIAEVQKRNTAPVKYLLNTHHHGDHTSGNIAFKGIAEHVAAHQNSLINQKAVAEKSAKVDKQLYPDQTFDKDLKLKLGKEKITGLTLAPAIPTAMRFITLKTQTSCTWVTWCSTNATPLLTAAPAPTCTVG